MNILVCVKQVPESRSVEIDPETGNLRREQAAAVMNPYDLYAVETAVRLKEAYGGTVTALSMGPPQAEAVLRETYMMGADQAALLSDPAFAGSDTLATSYTLAQGIRALGRFDLIICGLQTTDGDTAQVGPGIAEFLGWPHVSSVQEIVSLHQNELVLRTDTGFRRLELALALPALITVAKGIYEPRLLSFRRKLLSRDWPIRRFGRTDCCGAKQDYFGLESSPTQVERMFPPQTRGETEVWTGTASELAARMAGFLADEQYLVEEG